MKHTCTSPLSLEELLAYRSDELSDAQADRVEEVYFACAVCAKRLAWLEELTSEVRRLVRSGAVSAGITTALLESAKSNGLVFRTYALAPGTTVACTAAPEDDFILVRLAVPAATEGRVDLKTEMLDLDTGRQSEHFTADVPVDKTTGELLVAYSGGVIRSYPRSRWTVEAIVHGPEGKRTTGPYVLDHTPWNAVVQQPC
jgi:hypothetical protein